VRIDPVLVVVDPWQNFLPGNQNDSADTLAALGIIAEIRNKTNATFALVHHLNRAGTTAGSRALLGRCDLLFEGSDTVEPRYKARGRAIRFADPVRNRFSLDIEHTDDDDDSVATTTVGLRWESDEGRPPRGEDKRPAPERVRAFLAGHEGESFTTKQLAEELSLSWKLVDQTLGDLLRSQRVSKGQRVVRGQERAVWQARVSLDEGLEALG
jgi:hypothetical protein